MPVTVPDDEPIVAIELSPLVQVPPPASLKVICDPEHTLCGPEMVPGNGLTVKLVVVKQPVGKVYEIRVVGRTIETPVTQPVELTVATPVLLLAQVPPAVASDRQFVRPLQTLGVPRMLVGNGLTVIIVVILQPVASV